MCARRNTRFARACAIGLRFFSGWVDVECERTLESAEAVRSSDNIISERERLGFIRSSGWVCQKTDRAKIKVFCAIENECETRAVRQGLKTLDEKMYHVMSEIKRRGEGERSAPG